MSDDNPFEPEETPKQRMDRVGAIFHQNVDSRMVNELRSALRSVLGKLEEKQREWLDIYTLHYGKQYELSRDKIARGKECADALAPIIAECKTALGEKS